MIVKSFTTIVSCLKLLQPNSLELFCLNFDEVVKNLSTSDVELFLTIESILS